MEESLVFRKVKNDDTEETLINLIKLKNIFRKQLPKMPGEYIVRLVLDRKHRSIIATKEWRRDWRRLFPVLRRKNFCETAFLAISYSEQVKGYGTQLMNYLKNYALRRACLISSRTQTTSLSTTSANKALVLTWNRCYLKATGEGTSKIMMGAPSWFAR